MFRNLGRVAVAQALGRARVPRATCSVLATPTLVVPTVSIIGSRFMSQQLKRPHNKMHRDFDDMTDFFDPLVHDPVVKKLVVMIMQSGEKDKAEGIVRSLLERIKEGEMAKARRGETASALPPYRVLRTAVDNLRPLVVTQTNVTRGSRYTVPVAVGEIRGRNIALKNMVKAARNSNARVPMYEKLYNQVQDALQRRGAVYEKRQEAHKLAEANRAYAHLRFAS
eukprot:Clim_evm43s149 gene=Clim_evmTU43s149